MSRLSLGDFQITLVRAGLYRWDGGAVFGVVPKTLWSRKMRSDDLNRVTMAFNCYVIETGGHTILVETGAGDKLDPRARARMALPPHWPALAEVIAQSGIDPERIDIVINTHLHWDHCGGNTILLGDSASAAFGRATYYTRQGEWEHAHERHPRDSISYNDANYDPLVESGQMRLIEGEERQVAPGVRMQLAPGHNRDMMVVTAHSGGRTFCFFSDLIPSSAHVTPTWVAAFDLYPLECIDTKTKWLTRAARENWVCGFGHDAEIDFARIEQRDGKFEWMSYASDAAAVSE